MPCIIRPARPLSLVCALALLAACNSVPPAGTQTTVTGTATTATASNAVTPSSGGPPPPVSNVAPVSGAAAAADQAPQATATLSGHAGLVGLVDYEGVPLANASVQVYQLGKSVPIATGRTLADGSFLLDLGDKLQGGVSVKMVATGDGKTLVAIGPTGIIAAGSGNIIAAGGGNIIAAGGGNVVSPNGSTIIAAGGGNIIAAGGGNVVSPNGSTIIAAGGGNIIAAGGGNIIAAGGGNLLSPNAAALISHTGPALLAQGGANIIAAGGGNIIAAGGGNIIAAGGGNYRVLADNSSSGLVYRLTTQTTAAVSVLQKRFEALGGSAVAANGAAIDSGVVTLISTYGELAESTDIAIRKNPILSPKVATSFNATGTASLDVPLGAALANQPEVAMAFKDTAAKLATAIKNTVAQGGSPPDANNLVTIKLGSLFVEAVIGLPTPFGQSPVPSPDLTPPPADAGGGNGGFIAPSASPRPCPTNTYCAKY
jgi:hypothetical protein